MVCIRFLLALLAVAVGMALGKGASPERILLTGFPAWGPTVWKDEHGQLVPAGCGPEAARILLAYYDRLGYSRLVRPDPEGAIRELRELMGTTTVTWGGPQGLTWPWKFTEGLQAFVQRRYPGGAQVRSFSGTLEQVFGKAIELLQQGIPSVLLFDWAGGGGVFPTHYAVVVGYDRSQGRRHLVVNNGWGYEFQIVDMADPAVAPASVYWIEAVAGEAEGPAGVPLGPPKDTNLWCTNAQGELALCPTLRLHFAPQSAVRWPPSTRVVVLVPDTDLVLGLWE